MTTALLQVSSALEQAAEALESGVLCDCLPGLLQDLESDPVSALQALEVRTHMLDLACMTYTTIGAAHAQAHETVRTVSMVDCTATPTKSPV